jgi:hypothetical protein
MKKILFFLLLSGSVIAVQAQFGVNAGLNISTLSGSDVSDAKSKAGVHFGAFYKIPVSNGIAVQTEASYSMEGAKEGSSDYKLELGMLNLAALFRYNFQGGFNLATGPQYGFILSAKAKGGGSSADVKDQMKSGNFCWAFAAGYDLPMGLGFYGRYNLGLAKIAKDGSDVKSSSFQLGVRYNFINNGGKK